MNAILTVPANHGFPQDVHNFEVLITGNRGRLSWYWQYESDMRAHLK